MAEGLAEDRCRTMVTCSTVGLAVRDGRLDMMETRRFSRSWQPDFTLSLCST